MRWQEIFEAPMADYEAFGDFNADGSFRSDDLRAMRNPKWQKKLFRAFQRTPYVFNVYVYNAPDGVASIGRNTLAVNDLANLGKYAGVQPLSTVSQIIGRVPPNAADSITVLLVENEGAERVPLTPWILAHRVAHAICYAGQDGFSTDPTITKHVSKFFDKFSGFFNKVERMLDRSQHHAPAFRDRYGSTERINDFGKVIGTVRSARMGNLANTGEFVIEMMTQYLVQGKVTFQRPVLDDQGRTAAPGADIDPELLSLARQYRHDQQGFVEDALRMRYRYAGQPMRPRTEPSYTAYDAEGQAIASFGADRVERYRERGMRIEQNPPPSQHAIARYENYFKRKGELEAFWDKLWERSLMVPNPTATDVLDEELSRAETMFDAIINDILMACVGKALVL